MSIDFADVADSLKTMQGQIVNEKDVRYPSAASFSSLSIPYCGGDAGGGGKGGNAGGAGDDVVLRPSRLLQGEVRKPWLKKKDWRVGASWWITVVSRLFLRRFLSFPFFGARAGF